MGLGSFKCNKQPSNVYFSNFHTGILQDRCSSANGLGIDRVGRYPKKTHSATSSQVLVNPRTMNTTMNTMFNVPSPGMVRITNKYSRKY